MNIKKWEWIEDRGIPHLHLEVDDDFFWKLVRLGEIGIAVSGKHAVTFTITQAISSTPEYAHEVMEHLRSGQHS